MSKGLVKGSQEKGPMINERIAFPKLQLIGADGKNEGIVSKEDALRQAAVAGLDLVVIAEDVEGEALATLIMAKCSMRKKSNKTKQKRSNRSLKSKSCNFVLKLQSMIFSPK